MRDLWPERFGYLDIQQQILGNENKEVNFEETITLIEAKEAGRRSQATLVDLEFMALASIRGTSPVQTEKLNGKKCGTNFTRSLGFGGKVRPHKLCLYSALGHPRNPAFNSALKCPDRLLWYV